MKKEKLKLYLAHPFDSLKEIREWELATEKEAGIEFVNPFYENIGEKVIEIQAGRIERYEVDPNSIVRPDITLIMESSGIVSIVDGALSYGTIQEKVYGLNMKKLDLSLISNGCDDDPWLRHHSSEIFTNLKDLTKRVVELGKNPDAINNLPKIKVPEVEKEIKKIKGKKYHLTTIEKNVNYEEIMKMVYAYKFDVPVYSLITNGHEKHPWLDYHSTKIFTKEKDLEEFLNLNYRGKINAIHT
ncbi:MAG: hypothetical protein AABX88_01210 [Nanoarchaeota archaeon]